MRIIFTFFFIFNTSFAFTQNYSFDYFIKAKRKSIVYEKSRDDVKSYLFNSSTGLRLDLRKTKSNFTASLMDVENLVLHKLLVEEVNDELRFKYIESLKLVKGSEPDPAKRPKKIKTIKLDSLTYKIVIPNARQGTSTNFTSIMKFEKNEDNLIIIDADYGDSFYLTNAVNEILPTLPYKVVIKESSYETENYFWDTKIIEQKKINLTLEMPSQLTWKEAPKVPKNPSFKVVVSK